MKNHVVVLGYGPLTRPVLDKLGQRSRYVVVTTDGELTERLRGRGYEVVKVEKVDEEALIEVGVRDAHAVVVASDSDADDALAILTANDAAPDVEIIAVASNSENAGKLRRAGADTVVSPADIVGKLLVESALTGEDTEDILEDILRRLKTV
jgi:voltage-gated potassium channel